jgi:hypothetical protein
MLRSVEVFVYRIERVESMDSGMIPSTVLLYQHWKQKRRKMKYSSFREFDSLVVLLFHSDHCPIDSLEDEEVFILSLREWILGSPSSSSSSSLVHLLSSSMSLYSRIHSLLDLSDVPVDAHPTCVSFFLFIDRQSKERERERIKEKKS